MIDMTLGELVGRRINDYGMTQAEAAKELGIYKTNLSKIINGYEEAGIVTIRKLCKGLDLAPDVIEAALRRIWRR